MRHFLQFTNSFPGNIVDSGTIIAPTAIKVSGSTINGAIIDLGGSILATSRGIIVGSGSEILAGTAGTAIEVMSAARFLGGIVNSGTLVGSSEGMVLFSISTLPGASSTAARLSTEPPQASDRF